MYLEQYTLPYLKRIRRGLSHVEKLASRADRKYFSSLFATSEPYGGIEITDEMQPAIEAFGTALVVYTHIPRRYRSYAMPNGFSSTGMLQPPHTVGEFLARTTELYITTQDIAENGYDAIRNEHAWNATIRAHAFYEVGSELDLKEPMTKSEIEEIVQHFCNTPDILPPVQ